MKLSVIGCGYLGAVHAAAMASLGHEVVGIDIDAQKIELLSQAQAPFVEPGLEEHLAEQIGRGALRFSTDFSHIKDADVHFVCVGTPQREDGHAADLSALKAAVDALLPYLKQGAVVAGKSTVPVGTAEGLAPRIKSSGAALVWNPEFLREGQAFKDTLYPDRIVIGHEPDDHAAVNHLREVYAAPTARGVPVITTDLATAELAKGAANAFLATKLSFMNALAEIADAARADISDLSLILGHDPRIGSQYLGAGIGFGGGCLPKDIRAFAARAGELGATNADVLLTTVDEINVDQRDRAVSIVREMLSAESLAGRRVTVLGAAFKPNSDDIRDAPGVDIALRMQSLGADVVVTDPAALPNVSREHPALDLEPSMRKAVRGTELIVVATEWAEYRKLDPALLASQVDALRILDGRNCLERDAWREAGWHYRGMGRP